MAKWQSISPTALSSASKSGPAVPHIWSTDGRPAVLSRVQKEWTCEGPSPGRKAGKVAAKTLIDATTFPWRIKSAWAGHRACGTLRVSPALGLQARTKVRWLEPANPWFIPTGAGSMHEREAHRPRKRRGNDPPELPRESLPTAGLVQKPRTLSPKIPCFGESDSNMKTHLLVFLKLGIFNQTHMVGRKIGWDSKMLLD
eukprot:s50_g46.t1